MINQQVFVILSMIYAACYGILAFLIFHYAIPALRERHPWHACGVWGIGVVVGMFALAQISAILEYRRFAAHIYLVAHPVMICALAQLLYRARKLVKGRI